jgi:hypothetical protein
LDGGREPRLVSLPDGQLHPTGQKTHNQLNFKDQLGIKPTNKNRAYKASTAIANEKTVVSEK